MPSRVIDIMATRPANAWLFLADQSAWPTPADLHATQAEAEEGAFDDLWTAPMNGASGDLALVYFVAPVKAICFVARIAEAPVWSDQIEVNALTRVQADQWWAPLTPLIEIEPIAFRDIQAAQEKKLVIRGRTGKPILKDTIGKLDFRAKDPAQQELVDATIAGRLLPAARFVIALDTDPLSDDARTVDVATVTARGYDSPIERMEPADDLKAFDLIKSYLDEDPTFTVRQAVGLFGIKGMHREVDRTQVSGF